MTKPEHSIHQCGWAFRPPAWAAFLLAAILATGIFAQDDTPIIITDGSLTIQSAVPWASYSNPDARTRVHPHTAKAVTRVSINMPNHNQTITFSGQKCTVTVTYNSQDFTVTTGNNGRGLRVAADFTSFQQGATPRHLIHKVTTAKISRVIVMQGNRKVFDNTGSGGTRIVISYQ